MTGENGPPMDGWQVEPRPCVLLNLVPRLRRNEDLEDAPLIVRGDN